MSQQQQQQSRFGGPLGDKESSRWQPSPKAEQADGAFQTAPASRQAPVSPDRSGFHGAGEGQGRGDNGRPKLGSQHQTPNTFACCCKSRKLLTSTPVNYICGPNNSSMLCFLLLLLLGSLIYLLYHTYSSTSPLSYPHINCHSLPPQLNYSFQG